MSLLTDFPKITEKEKTILTAKLKNYFKNKQEICDAYFFGSFTQGRLTALSDIDIALYLDENEIDEDLFPYGYRADMLSRLMQLLCCNKLDLVILNQANLLLRHRVVTKGVRIFSRDIRQTQKREYYYIQQYLDFKPVLERINRSFSESLGEGKIITG